MSMFSTRGDWTIDSNNYAEVTKSNNKVVVTKSNNYAEVTKSNNEVLKSNNDVEIKKLESNNPRGEVRDPSEEPSPPLAKKQKLDDSESSSMADVTDDSDTDSDDALKLAKTLRPLLYAFGRGRMSESVSSVSSAGSEGEDRGVQQSSGLSALSEASRRNGNIFSEDGSVDFGFK